MKMILDILKAVSKPSGFANGTYINLFVRDSVTGQTASWQTGIPSLQPLKKYEGHRIEVEGEIVPATELDAATGQLKPVMTQKGVQAMNFEYVPCSTVRYIGVSPQPKLEGFPT